MEYANWKTITGMTIADLRTALDKELPKNAYKAIPEAPYLTDINPGYMKKCLNDVFGICGVGWGYKYSPDDLLFQNGSEDGWTDVLLKSGQLWFKLVDDAGEIHQIAIPASGGSENKQIQYALKGAITNMIGNAASQIGFQESVYMGKRSYVTTNGATACGQNQSSNDQTEKSTEDTKPKAHPAAEAKPTTAPAAFPYLVPNAAGIAAKHQGLALAAMSDAAIQFYAADSKFSPTDDAGKDFRQKCLQEVKARAQTIHLVTTAMQTPIGPMIYLAIKIIPHQGELFALMWDDIDWDNRQIHVQRNLQRAVRDGRHVREFSTPKTATSCRTITVGEKTIDVLRTHRQDVALKKALAGYKWKEMDLVFPTSVGTPMNPSNVTKQFRAVLEKADLKCIRFHDMRHIAASIMLNHGIPVMTVSNILGHSQPSTTLNMYGHHFSAINVQAAVMMDDIFESAQPCPLPVEFQNLVSRRNANLKES